MHARVPAGRFCSERYAAGDMSVVAHMCICPVKCPYTSNLWSRNLVCVAGEVCVMATALLAAATDKP